MINRNNNNSCNPEPGIRIDLFENSNISIQNRSSEIAHHSVAYLVLGSMKSSRLVLLKETLDFKVGLIDLFYTNQHSSGMMW